MPLLMFLYVVEFIYSFILGRAEYCYLRKLFQEIHVQFLFFQTFCVIVSSSMQHLVFKQFVLAVVALNLCKGALEEIVGQELSRNW